MSKKPLAKSKAKSPVPGYTFVQKAAGIEEYTLKSNGLRVLFYNMPGTGVVTTNITYLVGSRDELRGETGVAHMLEHMLFKPTHSDIKAGITDGRSVQFERQTGCVLNANTWKDRTTYYFSYPIEHLQEALSIEADRMHGVVLTDEKLKPEQGNVLSEFDMYNGDPGFALSVQMVGAAFMSHSAGHETIGYREDIEDYTAHKLERFYRHYYRPDNAVMMVIGDIDRKTALAAVKEHFGKLTNPDTPIPRFTIREPKQEGVRRVSIERPSSTNLLVIGYKHSGFPGKEWFINRIMLDVLTSGPESILHRLLVDTGKASSVGSSANFSAEVSLGSVDISLAPNQIHSEIESLVLNSFNSLDSKMINGLVKKSKANMLTSELFGRQSSLSIAAELTEYVSAGNWAAYADTPDILSSITTKEVLACIAKSFISTNLTIGNFIGKA